MQIRPTMTTGAFLAIMLMGPVFQAIGEPAVTAKSSRAELAQLQAPVGHRQPTQNDLPPSVREEEAPSTAATPQGGSGDGQNFDGKPPDTLRFGTPWPEANFTWITKTTEVAPGFHLILLNGTWGADLEVKEISLVPQIAMALMTERPASRTRACFGGSPL